MKIKPEDYQTLKDFFVALDSPTNRQSYQSQGLSEKRYQWDVIRTAGAMSFVCDILYQYLNDDHIDSALRKMYKENSTKF